mgnify:CR=1 FL=1
MSISPVASTVAFSNARRPYPLFSSINYADNGANMLYSGLQTAGAEALQPRADVHVDRGPGPRKSATRTIPTISSSTTPSRTRYNRAARSRQRVLRAAPPVDESGAVRTAARQRTVALGLADQYAAQHHVSGNWFTPVISGPDPRSNTNTHDAAPRRQRRDFVAAHRHPVVRPGRIHHAGERQLRQRRPRHHPGSRLRAASISGLQKTMSTGEIRPAAVRGFVSERFEPHEPRASRRRRWWGHGRGGEQRQRRHESPRPHVFPAAGSPRTGQLGIRWNF